MKRIGLMAVFLMAVCMMGGCLKDVPLTDSEMDIVAEYAAKALLLNALAIPEYQPMFQPEQDVTPTPTPTSVPTPTAAVPTGAAGTVTTTPAATTTPIPENSASTNEQLTKVVGVDGFELSYEEGGYMLAASVPSGDYFSLEAKDGRQYLIVTFTLKNTTGESLALNTIDKKLKCEVDINLGTVSRASLSMQPNDLQYLNGDDVILPGEEFDAVLVFEISALEEVNTAHVRITNQDDEVVFIKLK